MANVDKLFKPQFAEFCSRRNISMAILFGSQIRGTASKKSDIDLGIWLENGEFLGDVLEAARIKRRLQRDLITYLETDKVDLIILNRSVPLLKFQVAREGRPVYEKQPGLFASFCSRALREHNDARIFYRATEKYIQHIVDTYSKAN